MGNINIGRQGWSGIALETTPGIGVNPTDYVQFTKNTVYGKVKNQDISNATQNRVKVFSSVPVQQWGEGDIELYADPKITGYFIVGALGLVSTSTITAGAYRHTVTVDGNSTPQTLTLINDRQGSIDQTAYYQCAVDQFGIALSDGVATAKISLVGQFPQTTASGTATTASGTIYTYPNARAAFGSTIAAADVAALGSGNLKLHDFNLIIKNNAEAIFRHGNIGPDTINIGDFEASVNFKLYFENATNRNAYYASSKQAFEFAMLGANIAGGNQESTKFRFYQTRLDTFEIETGLSNFYVENVTVQPEYDNANAIAMDCVIVNSKSLYI